MSKKEALALRPKDGDIFVARTPTHHELPFTVVSIADSGISIVTNKNKVTMTIPLLDWNKYVSDRTIARS
jgi:hypothetical protein